MTDDVIKNQRKKTANFTIFEEFFKYKQDLDNHLENVHRITGVYCRIFNKTFQKQSLLNLHRNTNHNGKMYQCSDCGKIFKRYDKHLKHVETHSTHKSHYKKPMSSLKKSQLNTMSKEAVENIKKVLFETRESIKKSMWKNLIKDCPYYMNKIEENSLTEGDVIELIKDYNLSDQQVLNICKFLRQKWGKKQLLKISFKKR